MINSYVVTQPMPAETPQQSTSWAASLRDNWWLAGIALLLFIAALAITFG
jgi:hypothetical protein